MNESQDVYESLAAHLDRLPAGFPRTETGVEIRILKRLFSPEEARLAQFVTPRPESPEAIAARAAMDAEDLAGKLEDLSRKGLIFRIRKGDKVRYMAAQFVIGIWEYHVNDLDPDLIRDMNEYLPHFFRQPHQIHMGQLRTIPIPTALSADQSVMPYEEARRIIAEQDLLLVAPCICRKEHEMMGEGCDRPMESCLVFGPGAEYYHENGLGRFIDQGEALGILEAAERAGLVLQPSNAQKVANICTCCGCCCQILKNLKALPDPARYVASNFVARIDSELCIGCCACLERCQMDAIHVEDEVAILDSSRCIGCGLCVPTCTAEAITLESKPDDQRTVPPSSFMEMYQKMARERLERLRKAEGKPS
ncbi:MAG: 4Fe-4S binding protein [Syntrophobacteraceae bacterium]|nr:4Fe-4S binding protein [Syntrophobacteraceae bacterium]